jgi:hypothetical protein
LIGLRVTEREKRDVYFLGGLRGVRNPPTMLRDHSLKEIVAEAARLRERLNFEMGTTAETDEDSESDEEPEPARLAA